MQAQLKEEEDRQEREYSAARTNQYDNEGAVRYRPEDFHFLKVLGKGSFGKVSGFFVFLSLFLLSLSDTLLQADLKYSLHKGLLVKLFLIGFTSVWNALAGAIKDQINC